LSERLRVKHICKSETLDGQERHLALELPTSEMAHAWREGERSTPAKQHQGKA
jgi:hypothetical protein